MVERVAVHAADEDVLVAVVIVISNGHADIVAGAGQTGGGRHILEMSLSVIAEKAIGVSGSCLLQATDIGAVGEEDVERAIIVIVEYGDTPGHGLRSEEHTSELQ